MQKSIFLSIVLFSFFLVSCGNNEVKDDTNNGVNTMSGQEENILQDTTNLETDTNEEELVENTQEEDSGDTYEKLNTTMKEIFKSGKSATCTFSMTNEGVTFDAIMYVDGDKLSYTMNGEIEGNKVENNSIFKDGYSYSWSNISKDGWKMKDETLDDDVDDTDTSTDGEMEAEEFNQNIEFSCKKGVDSSKFDLPTDINFQDISNMEIPTIPTM